MSSADKAIEAVEKLATELTTPQDPDYKDDWERGFDAGRESAGRDLVKILRQEGLTQ